MQTKTLNTLLTEARDYIQSLEDEIEDEQEKLNST